MDLSWRSYGEDHCANCNLIGPGGSIRRKPMGLFLNNTAHSSWNQGFRIHHFEQFFTFRNEEDVPVFQNMKAYRNREHGIYAYSEWSDRGGDEGSRDLISIRLTHPPARPPPRPPSLRQSFRQVPRRRPLRQPVGR